MEEEELELSESESDHSAPAEVEPSVCVSRRASAAPTVAELDSDDEFCRLDMAGDVDRVWAKATNIVEFIHDYHDLWLDLRKNHKMPSLAVRTLSAYCVRVLLEQGEPWMVYPRFRQSSVKPNGLKMIRVRVNGKLEKEICPYADDDGFHFFGGLFGWNMMTARDTRVVLCASERDAMSVHEATKGDERAVALPLNEQLDMNVLPYLDDFDDIIIWFPSKHLDNAHEWARTLKTFRCCVVTANVRPHELLTEGRTQYLKTLLADKAPPPPPPPPPQPKPVASSSQFRTSADHHDAVREELTQHRRLMRGLAQWQRFPVLNNILLGFRPGELTIVTGGAGFGKTTFLCEYTLDLMKQGIRTLFCSFEMPDVKILKWMAIQFAEKPLWRNEYQLQVDKWLDRFERIQGGPVLMQTKAFMGKSVNEIALAIRKQVDKGNIQHVAIDNLEFVIGTGGVASPTTDALTMQEAFVSAIRRLSSDSQAHTTLVVHPRHDALQMISNPPVNWLQCTGRAGQEADNVLIIQRNRQPVKKKFLQIVKNRYGQTRVDNDRIEMVFNKETLCHTLIDTFDV